MQRFTSLRLVTSVILGAFVLAATPVLAEDGRGALEGTWKTKGKKKGKEEYFVLAPSKDRFKGRRLPKLQDIGTEVDLGVAGGKATGSLTYIDEYEGGRWRAKAKWEFALEGDSMKGRWERLDVNWEAKKESEVIAGRKWKKKTLTRLPRFGGYGAYASKIGMPAGEDASGRSAASLAGKYSLGKSSIELKAEGAALVFKLGGTSYRVSTGGKTLKGKSTGAPEIAIELAVTKAGLEGRVEWKDWDEATSRSLQSGWSKLTLEGMKRAGPAAVKAAPGAPAAGSAKSVEELAGSYLWGDKRINMKAADGALSLVGEGLPALRFSLEGGVLKAAEDAGAVKLAWELSAVAEGLTGRRQWKVYQGAGKEVDSGWVPVSVDRIKRFGPEAKSEAPAPKADSSLTLAELAGDWVSGGKRVSATVEGDKLMLSGMSLSLDAGVLKSETESEGVKLVTEFGATKESLTGRSQWAEVNLRSKKQLKSGWTAAGSFRRVVHYGPKAVAEGATASEGDELDMAKLEGRWNTAAGKPVTMKAEGDALLMTGFPGVESLKFRLRGKLLVAKERIASGLKLSWEFGLREGSLVGRRAWMEAAAGSPVELASGWVAVSLSQIRRYGPAADATDAAAPVAVEAMDLAALDGDYMEQAGVSEKANGMAKVVAVAGKLSLSFSDGSKIELALEAGLLKGQEEFGAVKLAWELGVKDGRIAGRRQWLKAGPDGKALESGWVAVTLEQVVVVGKPVEAGAEAPSASGEADLSEAALWGVWRGPDGLFEVSAADDALTIKSLTEGAGLTISGPVAGGIFKGQDAAKHPRRWELAVEAGKLSGRRQWMILNVATGKPIKEGWEAVSYERLPLVGDRQGEAGVSAEELTAAEGEKGSLVGTWKAVDGLYLVLRSDGEGSLVGHWKKGDSTVPVTLTIEGDVARGSTEWTVGGAKVKLKLEIQVPAGRKVRARAEWAVWDGPASKALRSGMVGYELVKLRRLG